MQGDPRIIDLLNQVLRKELTGIDGVPNLSDYDPILIRADVRQQFANDLNLEMAALQVLRPGVQLCLEVGDHASRELLERS